jgi:hypothetical protein
MRGIFSALVLVAVAGCGDDGNSDPDANSLPAWQMGLPSAVDSMGERRGLVPARGIIHLHSPYSHDACDGDGRPDEGGVNEPCLADLRAALCTTRMDYAALTDHDDTMADEPWEDLFIGRGEDELVMDGDNNPIAGRIVCGDGHTVLVSVGGENNLMPFMLDRHPEGTLEERHDIYNADGPQAAQDFKDLGGLAWIAHSEEHPVDGYLRDMNLNGMEIYNLHANIAPDIREEWLGLDGVGAIEAVIDFADTAKSPLPEPDLAFIAFYEPNQVALDKWDLLLGEGQRLWGSAGTDAHQNALPIVMKDGERGDSYRRMIRWFSNVALTTDANDPVAIEDAIRAGRFFAVFEALGTPSGFDVTAGDAELGSEVAVGDGRTLVVTVPEVYELDPTLPTPSIRARILRIDGSGPTEVAMGSGPEVTVALDTTGVYRVEVLIRPSHYGPYLGWLQDRGYAEREFVWIYSNPIFVVD